MDQHLPEGLVKVLQKGLNGYLSLDPPLEVDGIMGPKTMHAVTQALGQFGPMGKIIGIAGLIAAFRADGQNDIGTPV